MQRESELASCPDTTENGYFALDFDGNSGITTDENDIMVNQCESSITMEYPGNLSDNHIIEADAYAALYALGGYTYSNLVHEASDKQCNSANDEEEDTDNDSEGEEGITETNPKADEEALINQKSPYEQKFIREHSSLFSESFKPSMVLMLPPQ